MVFIAILGTNHYCTRINECDNWPVDENWWGDAKPRWVCSVDEANKVFAGPYLPDSSPVMQELHNACAARVYQLPSPYLFPQRVNPQIVNPPK